MNSSNMIVLEDNKHNVSSDTQKTISIEKIKNKKTNSYYLNSIEDKIISEPELKQGRWSDQEHRNFIKGILKTGKNNWKKLEEEIPTRTSTQIRSHAQKFLMKLLKKYNILSKHISLIKRLISQNIDFSISPENNFVIFLTKLA